LLGTVRGIREGDLGDQLVAGLRRDQGGDRRFLGIVCADSDFVPWIVNHLIDACVCARVECVGDLHGLGVENLDGAVAIAGPNLVSGGQNAGRTRFVVIGASSVLFHDRADHAGGAAGIRAGLDVKDTDTFVATIGEIVALGLLIDVADVERRRLPPPPRIAVSPIVFYTAALAVPATVNAVIAVAKAM
jgi:hypothetical protein